MTLTEKRILWHQIMNKARELDLYLKNVSNVQHEKLIYIVDKFDSLVDEEVKHVD